MADRPTYARDAATWRRYQPHLPAALRLDRADRLPREAWWRWRGLEVHLDRFGAPAADTTVLVLHGGGGYGRLLAPLGRALHDGTTEVVLPDLPGYGLSDVPPGGPRYGDWVACVADLVAAEHAQGRRVVLAGLSMGGMLAVHAAAAAAPGAVAGVLATCLLDPASPEVRRGAGRVPTPAWLLRTPVADRLRLPVAALAPVERMSSSRAINRLCLRDPQGGGRRVAVGLFRSWMAHPFAAEAFDRCPVLLLNPLADRWTPPAWSATALARLAAPTREVDLDGCEHWPLEQPGLDVLVREARGFVADVGQPARTPSMAKSFSFLSSPPV